MSFSGPIRVLLCGIGLLTGIFCSCGVRAAPSVSDPAFRGNFGDWSLVCENTAAAGGEQCLLVQSVASEDHPDTQMVILVVKNPSGGYILRVIVPLGVILPSGLGLKIDRTDIGRTGFMRCLANGCLAEVVMDDNLMKRLGTGDTAVFVIFMSPSEGVGFPIKLSGFSSGILKLQ